MRTGMSRVSSTRQEWFRNGAHTRRMARQSSSRVTSEHVQRAASLGKRCIVTTDSTVVWGCFWSEIESTIPRLAIGASVIRSATSMGQICMPHRLCREARIQAAPTIGAVGEVTVLLRRKSHAFFQWMQAMRIATAGKPNVGSCRRLFQVLHITDEFKNKVQYLIGLNKTNVAT